MNLRVLHVDTGRAMRGGQWQVLLLARELARAGVRQALLAPEGAPLLERAREAGIPASPAGWTALRRAARRCDVIHAHDARAHTMAVVAAWGKPLVVSRRVAFPVKTSFLSRIKYARGSVYLAVSDFVSQQLALAGVPPEKVRVVPDAVEMPSPYEPGERDAIVALESDDPGKGGALIREAARLAGLDVLFSSDLQRDLQRARMFVYISDSEGLGSAALLAMAHGVPVIASRVGGLPEAVEDGVTGLLTANRAEEIAKAMRKMRFDEEMAARMGAAGRERASTRFSPAAMTAAVLDVYRMVAAC
jgi:hypothetical protein